MPNFSVSMGGVLALKVFLIKSVLGDLKTKQFLKFEVNQNSTSNRKPVVDSITTICGDKYL